MADTPFEFFAPSGLTGLKVYFFLYGNDTLLNLGGYSATEFTNRKGLYSCIVPDALEGWHTWHVLDADDQLMVAGSVYLLDDTQIHRGHDAVDRLYDTTLDSIVNALLTGQDLETGVNLQQTLRALLAVLVGKISGANSSTIRIRDVNDTKDRVVASVDSDGNRTSVSLDLD